MERKERKRFNVYDDSIVGDKMYAPNGDYFGNIEMKYRTLEGDFIAVRPLVMTGGTELRKETVLYKIPDENLEGWTCG